MHGKLQANTCMHTKEHLPQGIYSTVESQRLSQQLAQYGISTHNTHITTTDKHVHACTDYETRRLYKRSPTI